MADLPDGTKPKCSFIRVSYDRNKIPTIPDLCLGEAHNDFHHVQNCLCKYNYLKEDSSFTPDELDETTKSALEKFQSRFDIPQSGALDQQTKEAMAQPRCAMPDLLPGSLDSSVSGPWDHVELKYALGKLSRSVRRSVCEEAIDRALATWSNTGVGLKFEKVSKFDDHDIFIEWRQADDPDHSMEGSTLAHADFPPGFSLIADMPPLPLHFDDEEHLWTDGAVKNGFDIETTCLHEIGHCLGLYHSTVRESIMFPTVSPNMTSRTLANDDLEGIRDLYGSAAIPSTRSELK
ncbi:hypothetical protein ASPCAL11354 [Aspergillus calidoustus]|uniref:Peptidase metallopeptidase domain-containing protein n=1 Tax=Aspergillus calidoustus TaxID=454130 RepID=A0A0U5G9D2_ASPCI|nr:hypothetical protein ASPCAL11354 [Aspergillus calidoustus]